MPQLDIKLHWFCASWTISNYVNARFLHYTLKFPDFRIVALSLLVREFRIFYDYFYIISVILKTNLTGDFVKLCAHNITIGKIVKISQCPILSMCIPDLVPTQPNKWTCKYYVVTLYYNNTVFFPLKLIQSEINSVIKLSYPNTDTFRIYNVVRDRTDCTRKTT